ncbi:MAG: hypothetical protein NXH75_03050 [Halobacteriovoraceae bacterium]|nr:hypothetical protein [Halobacteriovoraceae bacterium]
MKTLPIFKFLLLSLIINAPHAQEVDETKVGNKRLPGLKLSYTNSVILQQLIRTQVDRRSDAQKIQVTLVCEKKYSVRGRDTAKSYLCRPQGLADLSKDKN